MINKIFKSDNFSASEIKYKKFTNNQRDFEDILSRYFDNYKIKKVLQLDRAEINSENFQVVIERGGKEEKYLLRKHKVLKSREQIDFYSELLEDLLESGVRVSQIIKNKDNRFNTEMGGKLYSLFHFIEAGYFAPTKESLESVANNIAKMHLGFNKISDKYLNEIKKVSGESKVYFNVIKDYSAGDFREIEKIILAKNKRDDADDLFLAKVDVLEKTVTEVTKYREKMEKLPEQIIHSDLHPHNVLMRGDEVVAIVDFDSVRISQQARDVAFAVYRFGRQFFAQNKNLSKADAVKIRDIFIKAYESVKILSAEEKELMPALIKDEFLKKLLFVLRGVYLDNNYTWAKDLPKFIVAFEEIDYFWK